MKIQVAGEPREYADGLTVQGLIEAEKVQNPLYVTVSVNDAFVRSDEFASHVLKDGDQVEFMYFMGGGAR
ncbi:MAG: sulfur carrier protein ThiS [Coriobacteriales bacterium]|nr:sulfur carrier protein ThiS [Coriobacteriales bacterium]